MDVGWERSLAVLGHTNPPPCSTIMWEWEVVDEAVIGWKGASAMMRMRLVAVAVAVGSWWIYSRGGMQE